MPFLLPIQGPGGEDPQVQLDLQDRWDHLGLQGLQVPKVTRARQERQAQWDLQVSWDHQGHAGFLERWDALVHQALLAQQAVLASCQTVPKASSTPCRHLQTRRMETPSSTLLL